MRILVALLSALLVSLPCAGSLPALCMDKSISVDELPSCCQHQAHACKPGQPNSYCCPDAAAPKPLPLSQITMPAPVPAPEWASIDLPAPIFTPRLAVFHPATPPGLYRPALYLLHHSYRI